MGSDRRLPSVRRFLARLALVDEKQGALRREVDASQARILQEVTALRAELERVQRENAAVLRLVAGPKAAEVEGKQTEAIAVIDQAHKGQVKLYVDPQTRLLVKKSYTGAVMGSPGEVDEVFSDYRVISGVI